LICSLIRRLKKILGLGRVSAVAARVDRLSTLEPRVAHLEASRPVIEASGQRIEELERRLEALEALCREQVGLQYLQFAAGTVEARSDAPFSQRRAK
jgi:DNA mismatch repair protein MutH